MTDESIGTPLYRRVVTFFDKGDDRSRSEIVREVWNGLPWMLNVRTEGVNSKREREICDWCRNSFGSQAWPLHGSPGRWYQGGATVCGWNWFGFAAEADMKAFQEKWGGDPE